MIEEIFRKLHNPDFVDKVMLHMEEDGKGSAYQLLAVAPLRRARLGQV